MLVRRKHLCDGTDKAGKPEGPFRLVIGIADHRPLDGSEIEEIYLLDDGTWEFPWNVVALKEADHIEDELMNAKRRNT